MYPNLYYAFKDLFGVEWKFLRYVNSFGFFVAIAFILAAIVLVKELKRKSRQGFFVPTEIQVMVGERATAGELLLNFFLGFVLGFKILALFIMGNAVTDDPQQFIFSGIGSWPAGIILGLLFAGLKYWEKEKRKLAKPEKRTVRIWPHDRVGEITIIALVFGLLGAKIFDVFENWSAFIKDPASILSPAGLTFYGGLICAALAIWYYARRHKIGFWHLNDAAAPALLLSYSVGRIGCQVAGDGDWGIAVTSPKPFSWMPDWLWGYTYPHNVNGDGVPIPGCLDPKYCSELPVPHYPTPLYEVIVCFLLFLLVWSLRKRFKVPGTLFGFYLMLNGLERFFVEKIRVNNKMEFLGLHPTQAEVISSLLFLSGLGIWIWLKRQSKGKDLSSGAGTPID
ncbi:MAG: prolipoprotein diacylglyceryl transferase [Chitinophagaceae bacterium]|nr:prolipoprotein diacylglyceryl transferase [Chitinophagaceae bacterium]